MIFVLRFQERIEAALCNPLLSRHNNNLELFTKVLAFQDTVNSVPADSKKPCHLRHGDRGFEKLSISFLVFFCQVSSLSGIPLIEKFFRNAHPVIYCFCGKMIFFDQSIGSVFTDPEQFGNVLR